MLILLVACLSRLCASCEIPSSPPAHRRTVQSAAGHRASLRSRRQVAHFENPLQLRLVLYRPDFPRALPSATADRHCAEQSFLPVLAAIFVHGRKRETEDIGQDNHRGACVDEQLTKIYEERGG